MEQALQNITRLENTINNLTKKLEDAKQKIETLETTNTNLTNQINEKNKEIEQLNKFIEELNNQLNDRNSKIEDLNNEIDNLTQKLKEAQQKIETLENANTKLTQQINKNNKEIEQLNNKIEDLNKQLDDKDKEIENLNNKTDNLTEQLEEAQQKIETLENANKKLTQQVNKNNKEIEQLNNKIDELDKQLGDKDKEIEELNTKTDNLTQKLEEAQKTIETLKNTNQKLNNELEQAQQEITALESTNTKLTQQLIQAEKEIEELNEYIDELISKKPLQTTITINPIKSSIGSITNITANIMDENGDKVTGGKVVFKINGITLKDENGNVIYARVNNGLASISYKVQDVWIKDTSYVEAVYSGTANYTEARSKATDVLDITQGTATITLENQTLTAKSGQTVTLRAKIVDATGDNINKGKVVFKLNGKTLKDENGEVLYAQVKDGQATLDYTLPSIFSAKAYTLSAVFGGGNYQRAEITGKLILEKQAVTISTDSVTTAKGKTSIKAKIRDETGKLLVISTKLAIKINQKTILNNVTSTNGIIDVSFVTTLRPGTYELTIISGENSIYKKGTLNTVLKIA